MDIATNTTVERERPARPAAHPPGRDVVQVSLDLFARLRRGELPTVRSARQRALRLRRSLASRQAEPARDLLLLAN